ncbi:MAG: hypothetical protein ACXQT2_01465 [Methanotrichaceae archaeon]
MKINMDDAVSRVVSVFRPGEELTVLDISSRIPEPFGSELDVVRAVFCAHAKGKLAGRPGDCRIEFHYRVPGPDLPGAYYQLPTGPETFEERWEAMLEEVKAVTKDANELITEMETCKNPHRLRELIKRGRAIVAYNEELNAMRAHPIRDEQYLLVREKAVLRYHSSHSADV